MGKSNSSGPRNEILTCSSSDAEDEGSHTCENVTHCDGSYLCTEVTHIEGKTFRSTLTIENVDANFKQNVIECIMGDTGSNNPDEISIMKTYTVNVCRQPNNVICSSVSDKEGAVEVSCQILKAYSELACRIFPEAVISIRNETSDVTTADSSDMTNAGNVRDETTGCYDTSCSIRFYPEQSGNIRFHVEVFGKQNMVSPVLKLSTNILTPGMISEPREMGNNQPETSGSQMNKAFYLFLGGVVSLGVTVFLIFSWMMCTRRHSFLFCVFSNRKTENNEYEVIDYNSENTQGKSIVHGLSDQSSDQRLTCSTELSDSQNEEDTLPHKPFNVGNSAQTSEVPRAHVMRHEFCVANEYIVPKTPPSVAYNSSRNNNSSFVPFSQGSIPNIQT